MKNVSLIGIALYSVANLFAGFFDIIVQTSFPVTIDVLLIFSGTLFGVSFYFILTERKGWFALTISSVVLAFSIAIFNERVLGFGHPVHHLFRGLFSIVIILSAYFPFKNKRPT